MTKFEINYCFDEESNMFIAVCTDLLGFSLYSETEKSLKKSVIEVLRVYAQDKTISGKNVEFKQIELNQEMSLGL